MNRDFYFYGNLFLTLAIAAALFQGIIFFQLNSEIYLLDSFIHWFFVSNLVFIIATVFLLKYYYWSRYWFTFFTFLFSIIISLIYLVIVYYVIVYGSFRSYNIPVYYISLGANILYGISLVFSDAGKRFWLKAAGILMLIFYLVFLTTIVFGITSSNIELQGLIQKIQIWAMLAANLTMIMFTINFSSERRQLRAANVNTDPRISLQVLLGVSGILTLGLIIALAFVMGQEAHWKLAYNKRWTLAYNKKALELAKPFEARTYTNSKSYTLRYRFMKPLNYNPQKKYPMVVCLAAEYGTENFKQIEGSGTAQLLSREENRKRYPAFLFVPECPPGKSWGNIPGLPAEDSIVFETIAALQKEFSIDEKRLYVTGHSFGGYGTWHFICAHPDMFAAAIPMAGEGNPDLAKNIIDVPLWAFHGRRDRNVMVRGSRDMIEAIKKAGGHPRYTEFADAYHDIWKRVEHTPGLIDWLFAQKRN